MRHSRLEKAVLAAVLAGFVAIGQASPVWAAPGGHHGGHSSYQPQQEEQVRKAPPRAQASRPAPSPRPQASRPAPTPRPQASRPAPAPRPQASRPAPTPRPQASRPAPAPRPQASRPAPTPTPRAQASRPAPAPRPQASRPAPARPTGAVGKPINAGPKHSITANRPPQNHRPTVNRPSQNHRPNHNIGHKAPPRNSHQIRHSFRPIRVGDRYYHYSRPFYHYGRIPYANYAWACSNRIALGDYLILCSIYQALDGEVAMSTLYDYRLDGYSSRYICNEYGINYNDMWANARAMYMEMQGYGTRGGYGFWNWNSVLGY